MAPRVAVPQDLSGPSSAKSAPSTLGWGQGCGVPSRAGPPTRLLLCTRRPPECHLGPRCQTPNWPQGTLASGDAQQTVGERGRGVLGSSHARAGPHARVAPASSPARSGSAGAPCLRGPLASGLPCPALPPVCSAVSLPTPVRPVFPLPTLSSPSRCGHPGCTDGCLHRGGPFAVQGVATSWSWGAGPWQVAWRGRPLWWGQLHFLTSCCRSQAAPVCPPLPSWARQSFAQWGGLAGA